MLDWIEAHQGAVLLVLAAIVGAAGLVVLAASLRLMRLVAGLLAEVREAGLEERRPNVVVDLVVDGPVLSLALRNIGRRPAVGVELSIEPDLVARREGDRLVTVGQLPIGSRLAFLGPGTAFEEFLNASAFDFFRLNSEAEVATGVVSFGDPAGTAYSSPWTVDLAAWRRRQYVVHRNLDDLCRTVDDLRLAVQDLPDRMRPPTGER